MNIDKVVIGSRGSDLALWQARWVQSELKTVHPDLEVEIKIVKTSGDKIQDVPLAKIGGKGLFIKEIEEAILRGEVDIAVHSMKDVPVLLPIELGLAVILERDTPLDALVSKNGLPLAELPPGARVGTGSLRRSSQLLQIRPDLEIVPLRGNINTRLRKMETENLEAVILAGAGLRRMGWDHRITELISPDLLLPAMGQGAIGLETRKNHPELQHLLFELDHEETHLALDAERAFVRTLEGGCQVPIGAYATLDDQGGLILRGLVASLDGKTVYRKEKHGPAIDGPRVGRELAEDILSMGAGRILQEIYNPPDS